MDKQTVTLIERPYLEIVDDLLTAIVGGVVNEPIIFDVKSDLYPLAEPALDVRGITGTIRENGDLLHHVFQKEIDYIFDEDENVVIWQSVKMPDDDTTFFVDYFRQDSRSPLSDINVGSVTRTLGEAIGREIATVYQQINQAYLAGFVDTATGKSLDLVVAIILDIKRFTKDYAVGRATFFRDTAVSGNITIPVGVRLATSKGEALFQSTQLRTLQQGQVRIDVPIRATDEFKGDAGLVDGGAITELSRPIAGIARITNFDGTFLGAEDESDEELRARAKAALRALGKGTLAALRQVIFEERATLVETWDPNGPPAKRPDLGEVVLLVETEPARFESLNGAVQETRAAGIQATVVARYIFFKPRIVVTINPGITGQGKEKIVNQVIESLQTYVDGLSSGDPAEGEKLLESIKDADKDNIKEARIVDVITWRSDIGDPGAETLVNAILDALATSTPGDQAAQKEAIAKIVTEETPTLLPSGSRTADRSLVVAESGERATDEELENGTFKVVAEYQGEKWWVVLEMELADIFLEEAS